MPNKRQRNARFRTYGDPKAKGSRGRQRLDSAQPARPSPGKAVADKTVTDHALVRYMERVQGFAIEALRNHLLANEAVQRALRLSGDQEIFVRDHDSGADLVIRNGSIVTVQFARHAAGAQAEQRTAATLTPAEGSDSDERR